MTNYKVSKKAAFNDVKRPGLQKIVDKGCIKCRKIVRCDAIDLRKNLGFQFFLKVP